MRQLKISAFILLLAVTALVSFRSFETRVLGPELRIAYKDGTSEKAKDFVAGTYLPKTDKFTAEGMIVQRFFSSGHVVFWIDDCLDGLSINGKEFSLEHLKPEERCDLRGISLDLSGVLSVGENTFSAKIRNTGGDYRFSVIREHGLFEQLFALTLIALTLVWSLNWLITQAVTLERKPWAKKISPGARLWGAFALVALVSGFVVLYQVGEPAAAYWDENYYLADAQKYLNGTFFMQIHPPLGKLILALSAKIFGSGSAYAIMAETDYVREFPKGFDFVSYRILPAALGAFSALAFFGSAWILLDSVLLALGMSLLYIFENSMVVHFRGAMLDSTFQFFCFNAIFAFLMLWKKSRAQSPGASRKTAWGWIAYLGFSIGAATAVKYSGGFLFLLIPALAFLRPLPVKKRIQGAAVSVASGLALFLVVWQFHFALGTAIEPKLRNSGRFTASEKVTTAPASERGSLTLFWDELTANLAFFSEYNQGIPKLNFTKPDENGSPALIWPIGAKGINYRWDKVGPWTSYIQLQINPVVYGIGLLGLLMAFAYLLVPLFRKPAGEPHQSRVTLPVVLLLSLYFAYMIPMLTAARVLFLYTYFPALGLSLLLFSACFSAIPRLGDATSTSRARVIWSLVGVAVPVFLYFSPLTYHMPMSDPDVAARSWIKLWDLHCATCSRVFPWLGY